MALIPRSVRSAVLSWSPELGHAYRLLRDARAGLAPAAPTAFGFTLAGDPALAGGSYEQDEIGIFLKVLENASVCFDIGANVGLYTCLAASRGKHVVSVEPAARNLEQLYRNLLENKFADVEVLPLGLSSRSGIERLFGTGGSASFLPGWAGSPVNRYRAVPVSTLDRIVAGREGNGSPLIKLDVEGFELEVLAGAEHTLAMDPRPVWIVEICLNEGCVVGGLNTRFRETFEVFWSRGYRASVAAPARQPVSPDDVDRWSRRGAVDFGSSNYLFC